MRLSVQRFNSAWDMFTDARMLYSPRLRLRRPYLKRYRKSMTHLSTRSDGLNRCNMIELLRPSLSHVKGPGVARRCLQNPSSTNINNINI
ncbi:hypothetical protein EVAR_99777_1 [Eumeta japonica]|uniref:Uncharacterized protein n=1 Tax=Eumeta variegata TaxID=151549 RepID=A0A4C1ZN69_EUMVA|nr:hypothetical protein EVAR_99777_1 [Eumeta japonica]